MRKRIMNWNIYKFAFVSGAFFLGANAISIIIPLKMIDQGLSYAAIGGVMASFSLGILLVKLFIGRHSDIIGPKPYLILSLALGVLVNILFMFVRSVTGYCILLCAFGLCRGIFTSVNVSYTVELSDETERGRSFGGVLGITSLFTSLGGLIAGALYSVLDGKAAFIAIAMIYALSIVIAQLFLPATATSSRGSTAKVLQKELFTKINPRIYVFCVMMFLQTFLTGPMWNTLVPAYFYTHFAYSTVALGMVMSLDELLGSPICFVAGIFSDKINLKKFTGLSYLIAGMIGMMIFLSQNSVQFLMVFLLCSACVTCTYVSVPKAESFFIRSDAKGFEFALISLCAAVGDMLGNVLIGAAVERLSIQFGFALFGIGYICIALIAFYALCDLAR